MALLLVIIVAALVAAAAVYYYIVFRRHRLPLGLLALFHGGRRLENVPAVPIVLSQVPGTLALLVQRQLQMRQARFGLSSIFSIGGETTTGHQFMYGKRSNGRLLAELSLEEPGQFSMSWTQLGNVHAQASASYLSSWSASLTDRSAATAQFWPMIARYGIDLNLLVIEKVSGARAAHFRGELGNAWTAEVDQMAQQGEIYAIDMTVFARLRLQANAVKGFPRFTPATLTILRRDPGTGTLTPFIVRVTRDAGAQARVFDTSSTDAAWLYALQAAKVSITVWGIWCGHVYHWHLITAAMQMTMFERIPRGHVIREMLDRQSEYLIPFDAALLLHWFRIAPPTSISTSWQFLELADAFADGRGFFDDDPHATIERLGLCEADFTTVEPWDRYPVVRYLLLLWRAAGNYVSTVVAEAYASDAAVAGDRHIQSWIARSASKSGGNVRGLDAVTSRQALERVLTSLVFRVTAHGVSRLSEAANPAMTFVANFPPCLQDLEIPESDARFDTRRLLSFLPRTGTIGEMISFIYTFIYSAPYKSFIPLAGIDAELPFTGHGALVCNQALIQFRRRMLEFIEFFLKESSMPGFPANSVQPHQWDLNIET